MKKLLFCIKSVTGKGGGAEKVFSRAVNEMVDAGYEVTVLSFDRPGPSFYPIRSKNIIFLSLCDPYAPTGGLIFIKLIYRIRKIYKELRPDISVGFMHSSYIPMVLANLFLCNKIVACEHAAAEVYRSKFVERLLNRFVSQMLWKKTFTSASELKKSSLLYSKKAVVIENPLDFPDSILNNHLINELPSRNILCLGTLRQEKRFDLLVESFSIFLKNNDAWTLSIVGDGLCKDSLQARVKELGIQDNVKFYGAQKNVREFFLNSDFLVVCSEYESFGLVALEALHNGIPVLTLSRCTGLLDFINDGLNGVVIHESDNLEKRLAEEMDLLANNPGLLLGLKRGARNSDLSRYSVKCFAEKWINLIESR